MKIKVNNILKDKKIVKKIEENKEMLNSKRRQDKSTIQDNKEKNWDIIKEKTETVFQQNEFRRTGARNKTSTMLSLFQLQLGKSKRINRDKIKKQRRQVDVYEQKIKDKDSKIKQKLIMKKSYYALFVAMVILAGASVYTNFRSYQNLNEESYSVFSKIEDTGKDTTDQDVVPSVQNNDANNTDTRKEEKKEEAVKTNTPAEPKKVVVQPLSFTSPLKGEIIKSYSVDKVVYSKTLESWKTHDGIDIKGNLGDSVKAIEKGIVEKIYEDSFLGMTVVLDHGQGYKSIYSNLDTDVKIKVKQTVAKSSVIGKIGTTAIGEIKDETHLHFMLMQNNNIIDPNSKIKL